MTDEEREELKRLRAEREMLADDDAVIWLHPEGPTRLVNCNDCFSFASADCEEIPDSEFWRVYDIWKRFGSAGALAWVIERRGMEPFEPYKEPFQSKLTEARAALRDTPR